MRLGFGPLKEIGRTSPSSSTQTLQMNRLMMSVALATAILVSAGCASRANQRDHHTPGVTMMDWTGKAELEGEGGAVEKVDGIDVYRSGSPRGKFRVLGVIQTSFMREGQEMSRRERKAAAEVLEAVRQKGGDAVVVVDENSKVVQLASSGHAIPIGNFWIDHGKTKLKEQVNIRVLIVKYIQ